VAIDPDARIELHGRLNELLAERRLASGEGLAADGAYMADLEHEIAEVCAAYVGAAVTEIAVLRGELFGPQVG
jgi:septum formation topological specificity factor MinE